MVNATVFTTLPMPHLEPLRVQCLPTVEVVRLVAQTLAVEHANDLVPVRDCCLMICGE